MIEWLTNFGTGIPAWVAFLGMLFIAIVGLWAALGWYNFAKELMGENGRWRFALIWAIIRTIVLAAVLWATLAAFGPGQPAPPLDSGTGMEELIDKAPPEKSKEQIDQEAYDKQPEALKKQDQGFAEEKAEADAYLDELRKKHKNQ